MGYRLKVIGFVLVFLLLAMTGCKEYHASDDPTLRLEFSTDTLSFDTVFTEQGSATAQIMVYNRNANALIIDRVWMENGSAFKANVDGEPDLARLTHLQLNGGDSLFVFVRVEIDPTNQRNPVLVTDQLHFHLVSGTTQDVELEAYGQDVIRLGKKGGVHKEDSYHFTTDRPYLIFDTLVILGQMTIDAGAVLYMHNGASIHVGGDVSAKGTRAQPILIRGDRLDRLFDSVPYHYAGGGWDGIYLEAGANQRTYSFSYVDILSGNIGIYCYGEKKTDLPTLTMEGCRIHNHTQYGLVLIHTNATVVNTEISNCASYCVYCSGGKQDFIHSTIASYFGYTNIRIQSAAKEDVAAVFIDNLSKGEPQTTTSFYNSIITGYLRNQLVVATPFDQYYPGQFIGNYLKTDTLDVPHARDNAYWQKSDSAEVFRNTFYKYKEYVYYDFHLDSLSPAIGAADSLIAIPYPKDRDGISREFINPDAGCYQHEK